MPPMEWALHMMQPDTYLDTLAMMAIRNMIDVNIT